MFLECAQAAAAHYPVTGYAKDFPDRWSGTQIVTAREFLDAVDEWDGRSVDSSMFKDFHITEGQGSWVSI